MTLPDEFVTVRVRARPMSPDDRRAAIIDATIPLLRRYGTAVSTKQIAEAAEVAEGTLFRAFGDKDALISAAILKYFDPEPFRDRLRGIDPDDPTDEKLAQVLEVLRDRFADVVGFMGAMRMEGGPPPQVQARQRDVEWLDILERIFRPEELTIAPELLGHYLRLIALATSIPPFQEPHVFSTDELLRMISHGVLAPGPKGA